jgi:DNA-binding NarL/FixJ family response regulator
MNINVLLVDGRKLFREGLSVLLEKHAGLKVIGEAEDVVAAPKLIAALSPDVVILNETATTRTTVKSVEAIVAAAGAEGIRHARTDAGIRLIVLISRSDVTFIKDVLQAGASACLTKESASSELVTAIGTVMTRQTYLSPTIADAVVAGYTLPRGKGNAPRNLSSRELEILQRIADGQSTKAIASVLAVSSKTIETHRRRMMGKLGLHSVAALTKYAVREGLTSLEVRA